MSSDKTDLGKMRCNILSQIVRMKVHPHKLCQMTFLKNVFWHGSRDKNLYFQRQEWHKSHFWVAFSVALATSDMSSTVFL